jgi:hypothetical protein
MRDKRSEAFFKKPLNLEFDPMGKTERIEYVEVYHIGGPEDRAKLGIKGLNIMAVCPFTAEGAEVRGRKWQ